MAGNEAEKKSKKGSETEDDFEDKEPTMKDVMRQLARMRSENQNSKEENRKSLEKISKDIKEIKETSEMERSERRTQIEELKKATEAAAKRIDHLEQSHESPRELPSGAAKALADMEKRIQALEREEGPAIGKKLKILDNLIDTKERQDKELNIVISGLGPIRENAKETVADLMDEAFGMRDVVTNVKPLNEGRLLIVEIKDKETKIRILKGKKAALAGSNVYIQPDLTKRDREINWRLRQLAKEFKSLNKEVTFAGKKIRADGKWWKLSASQEHLVATTAPVPKESLSSNKDQPEPMDFLPNEMQSQGNK